MQCVLHILRNFTRLFDMSFEMSRGLGSSATLRVAFLQNFPLPVCHVPRAYVSPKISDMSNCGYTLFELHI